MKAARKPSNRARSARNTRCADKVDEIGQLSFVAPPPKGGRIWWKVKPTGDYTEDCWTGERLALEYLNFVEKYPGGSVLQSIVCDMPRPLSGVEIGFLTMVCHAARTGAYRAREISAYWDRKWPERRRGRDRQTAHAQNGGAA